jgi:hypothetical protein
MYEGRTRGKRMKYTYSDDEDFLTDSTSARRSHRNTRHQSPIEPSGPVVTASGRQVRRPDRMNVETASVGVRSGSGSVKDDLDDSQAVTGPRGRPQRSAAANHRLNGWASKKGNSEEYETESEEDGDEPDYGGDDEEEHVPVDSDEDEEEFNYEAMDEDEYDDDDADQSRVVKLRVRVGIDRTTGKVHRVENPTTSTLVPPASPPDSNSPSSSGSTVQSSSSPRSPPEPVTADVISVAIKQRTPEPVIEAYHQDQPPATTQGATQAVTAALAFRGSPEKPQHVSSELSLGYVE